MSASELEGNEADRPAVFHAAAPSMGQAALETANDQLATGVYQSTERLGGPTVVSASTPDVPGYEVLGILGRGGMGVVYQARHAALKRLVALKMIRAGVQAGAEELARFRAEVEAVARLQHPNIVQIYEVGEHRGQP